MMHSLSSDLNEKYEKFKETLKLKGSILIAYSGGVDSALLAKISYQTLGEGAITVFLNSETVPDFELQCAEELAKEIGIEFEILEVDQLSNIDFIKNNEHRCYYCRTEMAKRLNDLAKKRGIDTIAAGAHEDDLDDYRPGIKAFEEAGIWHPFIELKFSKDDIRELAKYLGLHISEKPSMACLSSRVPYGHEITKNKLESIEHAEEFLRKLGFKQYRARIYENTIRIEILSEEFEIAMEKRKEIISKMKELGFVYITLDLEGFRSGSMNETLKL